MSRDNRPPYIPLYVLDFVGDALVELMSTKEVGAYLLLICKAWHQEPAATLPNDDAVLARWSRVTAAEWKSMRVRVLAPWTMENGRWVQKRLRQEYVKVKRQIDAKSDAGKRGNDVRWQRDRKRLADGSECDDLASSPVLADPSQSDRNAMADGSHSDSQRSPFGSQPEPEPEPEPLIPLPPLQGGIATGENRPRKMRASEVRQAEYVASLTAYAEAQSRKPVNHP